MNEQIEAWNLLYGDRKRPWRGVSDIEFPFPDGGSVLDIGCGNGKTSGALIESGYYVAGIDFSDNAVNTCVELFPEMRCVCASALSMPFEDEEFDGTVMVHVMEHLDDSEIATVVGEVERILKSRGKILVRSFSVGDMRSGKGIRSGAFELRGNGIRYRYFSEDDLRGIFSAFEEVYIRTDVQRTAFGETRSRVEGVFEKR